MQKGQLTEGSIEQEIKNMGADKGPRIVPNHIDNMVDTVDYWLVPNTTTVVCAITLVNGFVVIGHAACAAPENFKREIGNKIAFENAREKIWELEGYRLKVDLHEQQKRYSKILADGVNQMSLDI